MMRRPRLMGSVAVGGLVLLCGAVGAHARTAPEARQPVQRLSSVALGVIEGVVEDEKGAPVDGAMVSALGATTAFAVTDQSGRFELRTLLAGPYLVRAHLSGFVASRGQIIEVRASGRVSSFIALHRARQPPILAAGIGAPPAPSSLPPAVQPDSNVASATAGASGSDDHGETAWRLRHARRGILKDVTLPDVTIADSSPTRGTNVFRPVTFLNHAVGSPARLASSLLAATPFSGQVNLLTTGSFDSPQQLFTTDSFTRSIASISVGAPVGGHADWKMRSALTQGDTSSWIVAGAYTTREPASHRYDVGLSYATQHYDGANPVTLRDVTDLSRNVGAIYAFDTFTITPAVALTYGARYARYDYLDSPGVLSPRLGLTLSPTAQFRVKALVSRRAIAPGAEEFLAPTDDTGTWLPPQRTFSSLAAGRPLQAQRTTHLELEVQRDLGATTLSVRTFRYCVADQLATMFGAQLPGRPAEALGHYFVSNNGSVDARGLSAGFRTAVAGRVHGSIEYSMARAHWYPTNDLPYMILVAPSAVRFDSERVHDVSTALQTEVRETSTRVRILYRVSNAFAHHDVLNERPILDSRFDVQIRQSLPFMNFSVAKWEMLIAVRNFFHESTLDQSIYDELLVVRPGKRVVGGLTLRF